MPSSHLSKVEIIGFIIYVATAFATALCKCWVATHVHPGFRWTAVIFVFTN